MKRNTIKWRIFKYNIIVILLLVSLTTVIFNVAIRLYIKKNILTQLTKTASSVEHTALAHGPDLFKDGAFGPPPPRDKNNLNKVPIKTNNDTSSDKKNTLYRFYFMLDRSLKGTLSVLNADYVLVDKNKNIVNSFDENVKLPDELSKKLASEINKISDKTSNKSISFTLAGTEYVATISPVSDKNTFGLGWIVIYSSIEKINQLQIQINIILLIILIFSALIIVVFSSRAAKKISEPFSSLNEHIKNISERNFGSKIDVSVDDELKDFVSNINSMSEKLEIYDKAQKTFLQNVSHEFRTPLMSIRSYAEGIKYEVVDGNTAADIIIDESKRLTHLVEDLLYLSRLDSIEENYRYDNVDFNEIINSCIDRMNVIALKNNVKINLKAAEEDIIIYSDEEKLSRAITNIVSNCIRYAETSIEISVKVIRNKLRVEIADDGPGFDKNELPNIFDRFYKGKKGKFGLGLSISKNIIDKLKGKIYASNWENGALFVIELPITTAPSEIQPF